MDDLVNDPAEWARFRVEPKTMIEKADLSEHERKLVTEGPLDELLKYLGSGTGYTSFFVIW